jgi:AraC-like DNA-binding protein
VQNALPKKNGVMASAGQGPEPMEFRCGAQVALRWTRFSAVWRYAPLANPTKCEGEKNFRMHSIGFELRGGWNLRGKRRPEVVDHETVIAGWPGVHYGCEHRGNHCESVCAISLRSDALDESDDTIFDKQVLSGLKLPPLLRCLRMVDDEQFDSFIFEMFDRVSRASLGDRSHIHRTDFRVQRMKRFIEQHAFEDIALADIARCVDLSPFTCIRQFKKTTKLTPLRYLSDLRFQRAQSLLKNPRLTIAEVGVRIGIQDRFYFSRWFSKEAGVSPQRFRQIIDP